MNMAAINMLALVAISLLVYQLSYGAVDGSGSDISSSSVSLEIAAPESKSIPQYSKFEIRIKTNVQYTNPFDPEEVNLQVHFHTPNGAKDLLPAFYDEEDGKPVWKVRYAPLSVGNYSYYAVLGDRRTEEHTF